MNRRSHACLPKTGFTLVELLVVIGIIAVLISILLPALTKARKQALLVTELSSMRQVGIAVAMYANDNKGYLPAGTGSTGWYPHTHDVFRTRLFGYYFDQATGKYVKGGPAYLDAAFDDVGGFANGPTSRLWGCPMTDDSPDWNRYGTSWWLNAGCMDTCDADGRAITCTPGFTGNWWEQTSVATAYRMTISGGGYLNDQGGKCNPDEIVLITDAGAPISLNPGFPYPGHLRNPANSPADVEGSCTLFVSGRAMWRTRNQLQAKWVGDENGWR